MLEFESRYALYQFIGVPNVLVKHWSNSSSWIMANHMYTLVKDKMKALIDAASFVALTADETSAIDNNSWVAIHAYVVENWVRKPLFISLEKIETEGATLDSLTIVLTSTMEIQRTYLQLKYCYEIDVFWS